MKTYLCCQTLMFITGHLEGVGEQNYRVAGAQGCTEEGNWNMTDGILPPVQEQQRYLSGEKAPRIDLLGHVHQ